MSDRPFDQHAPGTDPDPMTPGSPAQPGEATPLTAAPPTFEPVGGSSTTDLSSTGSSTTDVAKQEAASVGQDAKAGAGQVAQTAGQEVRHVAQEAKGQAQQLFSQVRGDVTEQARGQQHRAAQGLHGLAEQFSDMARGTEGSSMAAGLVQQAADRVDGVAGWLEGREPADLLDDVKRYARRNPGTFLAVCGLVGLVGGRLTRGLRDEAADSGAGSGQQGYGAYGTAGSGAAYDPYPAGTGYPTGTSTGDPTTTAAGGGYAGTTGGYAAGTTGGYPETTAWDDPSDGTQPQAYGTPGQGTDVDAVAEPLPTGEELLEHRDGDRL